MHKLRFMFFLIFCLAQNLSAQSLNEVCELKITNIENAVVDDFEYIFITNSNGDILKVNDQCKKLIVYSPSKTGKIKQVDIWSQFKIFAFYEEFQEFIILDRFLSTAVRYDLSTLNLGFISNATLNFQQEVWVIDESDFSLKLINYESKNIITSQQLNQYLDLTDHNIIGLKEYKGKLFVIDAVSGILIFDVLGNYLSKINSKGIINYSFDQSALYYFKNQKLFHISLKDLTSSQIDKPNFEFKSLFKKKNTFYGLTKDRLKIYK